jgi:AcrR family transcriptional regulator
MSTREALIGAATDLLDVSGVEGVTLREVGHRAGVSHNAPYKHFAGKQALLAAIAARELTALAELFTATREREPSAGVALRQMTRDYIAWALAHPARFKLVFGEWSADSTELAHSAERAWTPIVKAVAAAQLSGVLPPADPERLAALIRALAHGAVDLALAGHLSAEGKGGASPEDLVDDLFGYLLGRPAISATA